MHRVMHQLVHYSPWDAWSPLQMPCAECTAMASLVMEIETKTQMGSRLPDASGQNRKCNWTPAVCRCSQGSGQIGDPYVLNSWTCLACMHAWLTATGTLCAVKFDAEL